MLIASELVTNAVLYSGCTDTDEIELRLEQTDGNLRLSVLDPGRSAQSARVAIDEQRVRRDGSVHRGAAGQSVGSGAIGALPSVAEVPLTP